MTLSSDDFSEMAKPDWFQSDGIATEAGAKDSKPTPSL